MWKIRKKLDEFYHLTLKKENPMEYRIKKFRKQGITIGKNCKIYSILSSNRDCFLLEIKNNVTISSNVTFFMHDAAIGTLTNYKYTDLLGKITIGNNCFVGYGATILPGVSIADNTIVGAGSVVTKTIDEPGMVVAGNPAKYICSVESYIEKNKELFVNLDGFQQADIKKLVESNEKILLKRGILRK